MKLRQTRQNTSTAPVPPSPAGDVPARSAVAARAGQAVPDRPQPKRTATLRSGPVAGRISAATLAAAHRVSLFHAEARSARSVPPVAAEPIPAATGPAPMPGSAPSARRVAADQVDSVAGNSRSYSRLTTA